MGVFLPCILSIFGAILFLRLPWSVGQAGVLGALLTFAVGALVVTLTALSVAAISTNGTVRGGGAYFMISRALGVEFGGAVGVCFFLASSIGVTFYLIALATELNSLIDWRQGDPWAIKLYALGSLTVLLCISLAGAKYFTKFNAVVAVCLGASIIASAASFVAGMSKAEGYTGLSMDTLRDNLSFQYVEDPSTGQQMSFFSVLIVIFPAMTGVMAGANMSGDLARPGDSIGTGTLIALAVSMSIYFLLIVLIGASVKAETLVNNYNIMQDVGFSPAFTAVGLICSTVSSALGSLVSAGRVLQALARDNLFPVLRPFAWGTRGGDEPIPAVLLAFCIAACCVFIGSLNAVASIVSGIYLLVYLFTNVACFLLRVAGAPNFRPTFKYFSWHTALLGAVACAVVLFVSSPEYAGAAVVLLLLLIGYISYHAPATGWGDVSQAIIFHQVRKYLLRLDERKAHAKFWRPSMLLLVQDPSTPGAAPVIDWGNNLKKGGLFVIGSIVVGPATARTVQRVPALRHLWLDFIDQFRIKAFWEVGAGSSPRAAIQNLVLGAGLGGMKPNLVTFPFPTPAAVLDAAGELSTSPRGAALISWALDIGMTSPIAGEAHRKGSTNEGRGMAQRYQAAGPAMAGIRRMVENPGRGASVANERAAGPVYGSTDSPEAFRHAHMTSIDPSHEDIHVEMSSRDAATLHAVDAAVGGGSTLDAAFQFTDSLEWASCVCDTLALQKHVLLTRHFQDLDKELVVMLGKDQRQAAQKGLLGCLPGRSAPAVPKLENQALTIDVWCTSQQVEGWSVKGDLAVCLQLAHTLHRTDVWRTYTQVRLMCICRNETDAATQAAALLRITALYRFTGTAVVCVQLPPAATVQAKSLYRFRAPGTAHAEVMLRDVAVLNRLIRHNSTRSVMHFLPMLGVSLPTDVNNLQDKNDTVDGEIEAHLLAVHQLGTLSAGLGPSVLVHASGCEAVITDEL
jgi:potassium/chloride transporter 9